MRGKFWGDTHSSYYFIEYLKQFSFIGLTETWAKKDENFDIEGYKSYCAVRPKPKRKGRHSGGIQVYVSDSFSKVSKCLKSASCNILWILLQITRLGCISDILVGTVYISPENSSIFSEEDTFSILEHETAQFKKQFNNVEVIIMGDFNAYTGTENDHVYASEDSHDGFYIEDARSDVVIRSNKDNRNVNKYGKKLLELCLVSDLFIVNGRIGNDKGVGEYTCYFGENPSTIDYILSDYTLFSEFENFYVDPRNESHHMPLVLTLNSVLKMSRHTTESCDKFLPKYTWNEDKRYSFLETFCSRDLTQIQEAIQRHDIDFAIDLIIKYVAESAIEMKTNRLGKKKKNKIHEPWFDLECSIQRTNTINQLKRFRKRRCESNLKLYKEMNKTLNVLYINKKKLYADRERDKIMSAINENDTKQFWSNVNKFIKKKCMSTTMIPGEIWLKHFKNLFNPTIQNISNFALNENFFLLDESLDKIISKDEVLKAVTHLRCRKSPGEDGVSAEFYKVIFPVIQEQLVDLFNKIFTQAYFPVSWCNSLIIPIHKKGVQSDPNNFRGISLLSVFGKIFMNIMNARIMKWCEGNRVLCQEQGGFKKGFSTIDSVFVLETVVRKYLLKPRGRFYCAFIDFTKAFDLLNRDALWYKLQKLNMSTKMLNMLMSIYENVNAKVLTNEGCTEAFQCPWGVKQGCVLSPTLFNLYINDLPAYFKDNGTLQIPLHDQELSLLLYADDLVLFSDSVIGLQRQLNLLFEYCNRWNLQVNENKTKVMVFRNGGKLRRYEKWFYDNKKNRNVHIL